jgi:hypothetical protein
MKKLAGLQPLSLVVLSAVANNDIYVFRDFGVAAGREIDGIVVLFTGIARPPGACISGAETTSKELVLRQEPKHESKLKNVCLKVHTLI